MKNFQNYTAQKYSEATFQKAEDEIYLTKCPYTKKEIYVTSLSFEMEPTCYGEEKASPQYISQVPFENILDEFLVYVTDFYDDLNKTSEVLCYQEFGSQNLEDIHHLRTLIGKRFYAVPYLDEDDGEEYYNTVVE